MIAQRDADVKTTEITQVKPLLAEADITGALVTADAAHVRKETARYLVEDKGAGYLFTAVKDNQPSLFAALDALDRAHILVTRTAHDRGRGRDQTRTLQVLPAPDGLSPTPPRRSGSSRPSATRTTAGSARPPPPPASPAAPSSAAARPGSSPRPPAATGTSRPCTTSATPP